MSLKREECDLCKSKKLIAIYENILDYETNIKVRVNLLRCKNCDLIQQSEIFSEVEIEKFYLNNYHGRNYNKNKNIFNKLTNFLRERYYQRFISILDSKGISKDIKILDFGSGDGFLAKQLLINGYCNVYCSDFFEPNYEDRKLNYFHPREIINYIETFDAVFMLNTIEHLSSFFNDFGNIVRTMKDNSILIAETPNFDSPDSYIFKQFWGGLHQPRHTFIWSKKSLKNHLSLWDFTTENLGSPQSAHWAISVQNYLASKSVLFKSFLKNGRMPGYLILVIIFLPFGVIQNFLGKESTLNIFAKRNKTKKIN